MAPTSFSSRSHKKMVSGKETSSLPYTAFLREMNFMDPSILIFSQAPCLKAKLQSRTHRDREPHGWHAMIRLQKTRRNTAMIMIMAREAQKSLGRIDGMITIHCCQRQP